MPDNVTIEKMEWFLRHYLNPATMTFGNRKIFEAILARIREGVKTKVHMFCPSCEYMWDEEVTLKPTPQDTPSEGTLSQDEGGPEPEEEGDE